jgi:predicted Zn finger-like uncharacterized protein
MAFHVTQCPGCESSFHTSARVLQSAAGRVRCGACLTVFTAAEHFLSRIDSDIDDEADSSVFVGNSPTDYFDPSVFLTRQSLTAEQDSAPVAHEDFSTAFAEDLVDEVYFDLADDEPENFETEPSIGRDTRATLDIAPGDQRAAMAPDNTPAVDLAIPPPAQARTATGVELDPESQMPQTANPAHALTTDFDPIGEDADTDGYTAFEIVTEVTSRSDEPGAAVADTDPLLPTEAPTESATEAATASTLAGNRDGAPARNREETLENTPDSTLDSTLDITEEGKRSAAAFDGTAEGTADTERDNSADVARERAFEGTTNATPTSSTVVDDSTDDSTEAIRARARQARFQDDDALEALPVETRSAIGRLLPPVVLVAGSESRWGRRLLQTLGCLLLGALLAAQLLWQQLPQYSQLPRLRPLYAAACQFLECTLPPFTDLTAIRSDNLQVRSHPTRTDALSVSLSFRNTAAFPQPFPILILSFNSVTNAVIALREFAPEEYLDEGLRDVTEMPVMSPVQVHIEIMDPGADALNYTVAFRQR